MIIQVLSEQNLYICLNELLIPNNTNYVYLAYNYTKHMVYT